MRLLMAALLLLWGVCVTAAAQTVHELAAAGYDAYGAGDYESAARHFERALAQDPSLTAVTAQLGYVYKKLGRNDEAARSFRQVIAQTMDDDARHYYRREVQMLENEFDFSFYHVHRAAAIPSHGLLLSGPTLTQSQSGIEAAWTPPRIGYRDGRHMQIFGRAIWGYDGSSLDIRDEATQAGLGVRYKPLKNHNIVLAAERLVAVGRDGRDDWMLRASYSRARGYGPDFRRKNWRYITFYGDIAVIDPADPDLFLAAEARGGQSFLLSGNGYGPILTMTPHVVVGAVHQKDSFHGTTLVEGGPGIGFKLYFADSPARAHGGSAEILLQYRAKITGDSAGSSGFVLTLALLY